MSDYSTLLYAGGAFMIYVGTFFAGMFCESTRMPKVK